MSYLIASNAHKLLHCIQSLLNVWIFIQISQSSSEDPTGKLFKSQPAFILKLLILRIRLKRTKNAVFSNSKMSSANRRHIAPRLIRAGN